MKLTLPLSRTTLICLFIAAIIFQSIPFVGLPIKWLETYFHEISHGLMAMLTGGKVLFIELNLLGSGVCVSQGGWRFLVAFSGYVGATLFGLLMVLVSSSGKSLAKAVNIGLMLLLSASLVFWTEDLLTAVIQLVLLALLGVSLTKFDNAYLHYLFQFIGICVLLNALKSPLYLIDARMIGDGATLAKMTFIPEIIWVLIWFALGVASFYWLWLLSGSNTDKYKNKEKPN